MIILNVFVSRMHLLKISKHRRRKWRILSSLSLQNCTRVQVDLLPRMVGKKMTNSKMNCSCDIFEHFISPAPCVAESDI